eukprot:g2928.t1
MNPNSNNCKLETLPSLVSRLFSNAEILKSQLNDPLDMVNDATYWRDLNPSLHVCDALFQKQVVPFSKVDKLSHEERYGTVPGCPTGWNGLRHRMEKDGYFSVEDLPWTANITDVKKGIENLLLHGWPATFILVYDEAWALAKEVSELMSYVSGGNCNNMDMLAWHVDPNKGDSGFSPHRDRQPEDLASSFRKDGSPKYSTCWIPLTDAVPDNSCLYFIPRAFDPGYGPEEGDLPGENDPDPLQRALLRKEDYQNIRAVPVRSGSAVMFSHRIIHWGSSGRRGYHTPRVAFSFAASDPSFEPAYFLSGENAFPKKVNVRLALAAGQMISYYDRFQFSGDKLRFFYRLFKKGGDTIFHKSYREKVITAFVEATQETEKPFSQDDEDEDDDALDEAMDAILDAHFADDGIEFHDDYDDEEKEEVDRKHEIPLSQISRPKKRSRR